MRIVTLLCTSWDVGPGLMMHNPAGMKGGGDDGIKREPARISPAEEALGYRYVTDDGYLWFPAGGPRSAIIKSAAYKKINKKSAPAFLRATVFPAEDRVLLINPDTQAQIKSSEYTVDARRVGLGKYGSVVRGRPVIYPWAFKLALEVDDQLPASIDQMLLELGNEAGRMVGIGDYRPECSGKFGRFTVELVTGSNGATDAEEPKPKKKKK